MSRRAPRERAPQGASLVGQRYDVEVGPVAHGGHCVARHEGRVLFVRHALPGEHITAEVTDGDEGSRFLRADAVAVHRPSPERVTPPCPLAHPGGCGGCDFQHAALPAQRDLKAAVVAEQLQRLAGLERTVEVEPVEGDVPANDEGLRWRTRMQYHRLPDGRLGLRKHRSHDLVPVADCPIEHPGARVLVDGRPTEAGDVVETVRAAGEERSFTVAADGFWQVHPGAPRVLVETVLSQLQPRAGDRVLDLYAGAGLFSAFLADAIGPTGRLDAVEGDTTASGHAAGALAAYPWSQVHTDRVDRWLSRLLREEPDARVDLVVLDPPRTGAKRGVVAPVAALRPRAVSYVACDPAALARDTATFAELGYRLDDLRAFDLFPMTHHVECVARFVDGVS
ncbi:MAG: class I SAM-dependent RNA methyltransferase [Nocardioides sp.]|nr:class I SAM-dependent RNA methyltransferase [Nocardioides sp.]